MIDNYEQDDEALRRERIAKRRAQMRREKERQRQLRRRLKLYVAIATGCICFVILIMLVQAIFPKKAESNNTTANAGGNANIVTEVPTEQTGLQSASRE